MTKTRSASARLAVKVTARAARSEIVGWTGDRLRIRIAAVPEGGKANAALEAFLSDAAGLPRSDVRVATGRGSTLKLVEFAGVEQAEIDRRFGRPGG
ncbi:MAG TPA: DUF167 domain-containing protein [Gammaproteobacteria bacterium]|nr:DUF167 domain-containing protein [Gammaproteobacteria bacterium]